MTAVAAPPVAPDTGARVKKPMREVILPAAWLEGLSLRRFTLDEYHRLIEIGFFNEDERVELLAGVLVSMSPIYPPHANTVDLLLYVFSSLLTHAGTRLRVQGPISIPELESEPEPDLVILRVSDVDFTQRHPYPQEVLLVAEVSDSSLTYDRTRKGTIYAHAGIPEFWIWNLVDDLLEVYRDPHTPASGDAVYQTKSTFHHGESVAPLAFPDFDVAVDDILPSAASTV
ncbi:MAG: Uma2 family endonuclease [Caldilineaceae bacterium]|nr:Uma2 family endonuclease [Caldilineaceae bacterium]MDE0633933.1 Uma2 family endonuclease [Caldilineaceae bacterium]MXZ21506.1 Uma2 family endonuclease [Caldilineaceae bacterium SB0665_bin_25]